MKLGKMEHKADPKTLRLSTFMATDVKIPVEYDFDAKRKPFPMSPLGNNDWGNCVKVSQANYTLRAERIERRSTPMITAADVIQAYRDECLREFGVAPGTPGDQHDNGLVVLDNLVNWRKVGWDVLASTLAKKKLTLKIDAFGEVDNSPTALRQAIYMLGGIIFGVSLPRTAATQIRNNMPWDVVQTFSPDAHKGSWGGHAIFVKKFTKDGLVCITWGKEQFMSNAFVEQYTDEAWGVIDALDSTKLSRYLDVSAMETKARQIGINLHP